MSFFIPDAFAQAGAATPPGEGGFVQLLLPFVIVFIFIWLFIMRPQSKRAKEHRTMVEGLSKGDEIVTNGGLLAKVTGLSEQYITVELADGVQVKLQRQSVATVLPKGTIKSA